MSESKTILEIVTDFLRQDQWPFVPLGDQPLLHTNFKGHNGQWSCVAQAREEMSQFVFYSVCPVSVPEHKRLAMAEFITRANYGMVMGNLEMDMSDGEVRYKTSIDVEGDRLSPALVRQVIYTNVVTMDQYLPGIMSVIYGQMSPLESIAQVER